MLKRIASAVFSVALLSSLCPDVLASGLQNKRKAPLTTKGDLFAYSTTDARLPVGTTDGMVLSVDSSTPTGLKWGFVGGGGAGSITGGTNLGAGSRVFSQANGLNLEYRTIVSGDNVISTVDANTITISVPSIQTIDVNGRLAVDLATNLAVGTNLTYVANRVSTDSNIFDSISPTNTKGDLIVHNGADNVKQGVGANGRILSADSAQTNGIAWVTTAPLFPITTKGDLITSSNGTFIQRLAVGSNGTHLSADSAQANGMSWASNPLLNAPSFSAERTINQINVLSGTFTKVTFDVVSWDTNSNFSVWPGTSRFTPTRAGVYNICGGSTYLSQTTATLYATRIYKNGSIAKDINWQVVGGTAGSIVAGCAQIRANGSTDFIELYTYHETGSARNLDSGFNGTYFQGSYLRE